jgi:hypothetical protein
MGEMADMEIANLELEDWDWENDRLADAPTTPPLRYDWRGRPLEWRQKDGRIIALKDMSTAHLRRTKALLERNAEALHMYYVTLEFFEDFSVTQDFDPADYLRSNKFYKAICRELRYKEREDKKVLGVVFEPSKRERSKFL